MAEIATATTTHESTTDVAVPAGADAAAHAAAESSAATATATATATAAAEAALGVRNRLVITLLLISTFVVILNETIMGVALPRLMEDLSISASAAQWLTGTSPLAMASRPLPPSV